MKDKYSQERRDGRSAGKAKQIRNLHGFDLVESRQTVYWLTPEVPIWFDELGKLAWKQKIDAENKCNRKFKRSNGSLGVQAFLAKQELLAYKHSLSFGTKIRKKCQINIHFHVCLLTLLK